MPYLYWIVRAVYFFGFILVGRKATWLVAHDFEEPEGIDWILGVIAGAFVALFWPVVAPCYKLYELGIIQRHFAKPPKSRQLRMKAEEMERKQLELEARERRIDSLERNLGIGPYQNGLDCETASKTVAG